MRLGLSGAALGVYGALCSPCYTTLFGARTGRVKIFVGRVVGCGRIETGFRGPARAVHALELS